MTGVKDFNYNNFNAAAAILRAQGYTVENPAENETPPCGTWLGYMRSAIKQLVMCDELVALPMCSISRSACIQISIARALGINVDFDCEAISHLLPAFEDGEQK